MKKFGFLSHLDMNLYLFRLPIMLKLISLGHEVYAIYPKSKKNNEFEKLGIKVVNYDIERRSLNPFSEKKAIENIYQAIQPIGLDVLHTFTAKPNIYGTFAGRRAKIPKVFNLVEGLGSFYVEDNLKSKIVRFIMERLYRKAFRLSDGCVFVNSDDPSYMYEKGLIKKEKITIIKSVGVDTEVFSMDNVSREDADSLRSKLGLKDKKVVLMVARAIWHKGIREYYEAARVVKKRYQDVEFLLVGGTDEGNRSCADSEFLENGKVKWLGERHDVLALTALSDIYVLPSYREGVPRTLLEAASMSKPIVTTNVVGCKEVVEDGFNGFLVPVKNVEILSEKIIDLLENEQMCGKMGTNSRTKALKEFDVERVVRQYMDFYKNHNCFS